MSYEYSTTGRTASTSSIYDYPEHLNPFYEDENHKRLRFWQFGNHRSDKPRSDRRGSLVSIRDGLRDMWEFKTFRLKKKRSSSLGINKTSESPPPLRREDADSHYNTISNASAYRNTINTMGSGYSQSTTTTPQFQRNSRYRSSMQDQSKENGIGLHRNDRYRSTIQNGFATYSGNMVTSTPRSRYNATDTTGRGMTAGVSQSSLKSSNPFDDDEMDDSVSLNDSFNNGTLRQSMTRQRKKRRAPPPPPVRNLANTSVDSTHTVLATRLKIDESPPPEDPEDVKNLTNLTAEIESFVRTTSDDEVNRTTTTQPNQFENLASTNDSNNNHVTELVIVERKEEIVEKVNATQTDRQEQDLSTVDGSIKSAEPTPTSEIPEPVEHMSRIEELRIEETESKPVAPPQPSPRSKSSPPPIPQTPPVVEGEDLEGIALPETPVPARRLNKNRNQIRQTNGTALRITESSDSATASTTEEEENMESKAIKSINYEFQYKVEPIKTEIDEKIGTARLMISESTGDISSFQNTGTERRRSVRDIIESINKSQSLLKVNHESTGILHSAQSNDSVNRNIRELNEREKEIQRMLHEMEATLSNVQPEPRQVSSVPPPINKRGSYYDNVPEGDENLDNLEDRNNLLSKSALRSKKSPTKSLGIEQSDDVQFQDCIDWNPLPKPRRSRHFPDSQANQSTSAAGGVLTVIDQNNNGNTNQS
ncbi:uncharacterized protein LOC135710360 [Ochlerotatus camptorhynchus]|uniref:uncharacterized protein LOC135710360 n=1 Tax=Ochlerotatus camptorhynchus TaxID=644619 RepID=UPI0031CDE4BA